MSFMDDAYETVKGKGTRVVYPEGLEERAIRAARWLSDRGLVAPVLIGPKDGVQARAKGLGVALDGIELRDPATDPKRGAFEAEYLELRKHKGVTAEVAHERAGLPHYFAALAVRAGEAAGFVSGLNSETKPFLPAFEVIKMAPGFKRASSVFVMAWPDKVSFYADCSMNIAPDAETLAEIGRATARSARAFGHEPRVAFLSFSTRDSAKDASIDKVKEAVALVRKAEPGLLVDGEMQFDAAIVPEVARKKCPGSPLDGRANVFIFPDLNSGNIAYKITERLGGARAIGPIFQGLNKPANDVSRGCSVQDFADVAVITALQARGA
ncbi:MAG TPA: phosphate acetyltransferase [Vicinamibacteria bacterium]|nr:phosphate acetyltransferase [Vicinamibacteria bacterium]